MSKRVKTQNGVFLLIVSLFWYSEYVFIPYFTPYLRGLGIVGSAAGIILGTYGFSQMALRIPFGVAANRSGNHKAFMAAGFISLIAAGILLTVSVHPAAFFVARFLAGLASSTWVSFTIFFTNRHAVGNTGKAISLLMVANNCGTLSSYLFGIVFFDRYGISFMFMMSVTAAVTGMALLFTIKNGRPGDTTQNGEETVPSDTAPADTANAGVASIGSGPPRQAPAAPTDTAPVKTNFGIADFGTIVKIRGLLLFSLIAALKQIITFATVMSFTSDHVRNHLGASGRELAFLSVAYSVACIIGASWVRTGWCAKIPYKYQLAVSFLLSALYCMVVPNTGSLYVVYLFQLIGGIGQAAAMTLTMALALGSVPQTGRSAAMGVYQSIYSLGMTLGPVMMGGLLDVFSSFGYACYAIIAVCAAGAAICLKFVKQVTKV